MEDSEVEGVGLPIADGHGLRPVMYGAFAAVVALAGGALLKGAFTFFGHAGLSWYMLVMGGHGRCLIGS